MELFHRRYLCFFAFLFLLSSFIATLIGGTAEIIIAVICFVLAVTAILLTVFNKKLRFAFAASSVTLVFVFISFINSFVYITLPTQKAEEYVGSTKAVEMKIISCEYSSNSASEYLVRLRQIDGEEMNIKSYLYCDFPSELSYGDTVMAEVDITVPLEYAENNFDLLLSLVANSEKLILYKDEASPNYFSADGIMSISHKMQNAFAEYVDRLFGEESGALVKGFLVNDTSDIPFTVRSDFKRSGTLHLLAVSGLHIVLLMGLLEFVLKKILVPKKIRCAVVAAFAILFLALTNFSASAVRSVLMLFAVYVNYMFSEDGDGVTALFVSVFLITLFSPFSVYDLGMWMSFFATLGLLTVYPLLESKLPKISSDNRIKHIFLRFCLWIVKTLLLTFVANVFLLPIMWYFFGEISISAFPANLVLSPLSSVYLPLCAVATILGAIPVLNRLLVLSVSALGQAIVALADVFADIRGGVLSLNYPFVKPLAIIFIISFALLLVIRLKQKLWVCVPPVIFCLAFGVCLTVFSINSSPQVKYINDGDNEYLFFENGGSSTVCDVGSGGYGAYTAFVENVNPYSTEIDNYILTHCHYAHLYSTERILTDFSVRNLYLPLARNKDELKTIGEIYLLAREYDTEVVFYESGEAIELFGKLEVSPYFQKAEEHPSVSVTVSGEDRIFTYTDASESADALLNGAQSRYFLLGTHGHADTCNLAENEFDSETALIFATKERKLYSETKKLANKSYVIIPKNNIIKLELPLD